MNGGSIFRFVIVFAHHCRFLNLLSLALSSRIGVSTQIRPPLLPEGEGWDEGDISN